MFRQCVPGSTPGCARVTQIQESQKKVKKMFNPEALKNALNQAAIKPAELSRLTDIPKNSISLYLKGKVKPPATRIAQLAQALNVKEESLCENSTQPIPSLKLLSVTEAAKIMGCSPQRIRQGIINNQWNPPIGSAIRSNGEKGVHQFHIPKKRVERYMLMPDKEDCKKCSLGQ